MAKVYTIVKKGSAKHREVLASHKHKNTEVLPVNGSHVLVPSRLPVDYGNIVSHAKNRTRHRRLANVKVIHVLVDGMKKAFRLTGRDVRTFKKVTGTTAA